MKDFRVISLQMHITGRCNLRCKHCYIDEHQSEMSYSDIKKVIKQFDMLIKALGKEYPTETIVPQLRITGGEPFLHKNIKRILKFVCRKKYFLVIMSNGTLVRPEYLRLLKQNKRFQNFQVSIDGTERTHDEIRGDGNFGKVIEVLQLLYKNGVPTRVSFTAHEDNFADFPIIAEICRKYHVSTLWSDRYIPVYKSEFIRPISTELMPQYISILRQEKENPANEESGLRVENYRALQFLGSEDSPYFCKAGETLITVDEYGNIMPCRRLPIVCGNINNTTLS